MYSEDDLLPLSGLQQLMSCERQWGLIHIEQMWEENRLTAEGRVLHERAHQAGSESRPRVRTSRGLRLHSVRLGLVGQAAWWSSTLPRTASCFLNWKACGVRSWSTSVAGLRKMLATKSNSAHRRCVRKRCLAARSPKGALYYGEPRRRTQVVFDSKLRARTGALAARMHELYQAGTTPSAAYEPKCEGCSLMARCLPRLLAKPQGVARYLARAWAVGEE
jgi:CRISPR-associated exonuclease Cas4